MVDRFSDGRENLYRGNEGSIVTTGMTPPFTASDNGNATGTASDAAAWREAGAKFVGGTLAGVESKLGYLKRLGVTVLWISPIFKQVPADNTYHGYGIQHFLDVDPNFGTREDLRRLVNNAHSLGIRVILDVILNHSGDVFRYQQDDPAWNGQKFPARGFRDQTGAPALPFEPVDLAAHPNAFPDSAIWPREFQARDTFTREGHIGNFDFFPEFADGDFFGLKDLHHGERRIVNGADQIDDDSISPTLLHLCAVYKFWIAFADIGQFFYHRRDHRGPRIRRGSFGSHRSGCRPGHLR